MKKPTHAAKESQNEIINNKRLPLRITNAAGITAKFDRKK